MAKRTESPSFMPHTRYRQSAEPAILVFPVFSFLTPELTRTPQRQKCWGVFFLLDNRVTLLNLTCV